jgi:saccharopine dehydrogenase-like NADP-dependent oxidoreductase
MKKVLILGADGQIARWVIEMLANKKDVELTLFLRHPKRLKDDAPKNSCVVQGDVPRLSN